MQFNRSQKLGKRESQYSCKSWKKLKIVPEMSGDEETDAL